MSQRTNHLRYLISLFILMTLGMINTPLKATHLEGGQMTYRCLGTNSIGYGIYEVTLVIRRDCEHGAEDAPFDSLAKVRVFGGRNNPLNFLGKQGNFFFPIIEESQTTVTDSLCASNCEELCLEEATYQLTLELPMRDDGYYLSYQRCCRNEVLTNVIQPLQTGGTWFVRITPESMQSCNNSAQFGDWPDAALCLYESYTFSHAATDEDGDSLAYRFYQPFSGGTENRPIPTDIQSPPYDPISYEEGYSLDNLMDGEPGLTLDPVTGELNVTPTQPGTFLIGLLVEEWKDGDLVSTVRRDFQFNVCGEFVCEAPTDTLSICEGDEINLMANFTPTPTCKYEWAPSEGLTFGDTVLCTDPIARPLESTTYMVTVSNSHLKHNDHEPTVGFVHVEVTPLPRPSIPDTMAFCAKDTCAELVLDQSLTYEWSPAADQQVTGDNGITFSFCPLESTKYYVTISDGSCSNVDSVVFEPLTGVDTTCIEENLALTSTFRFDNTTCLFEVGINTEVLESMCLIDASMTSWILTVGNQTAEGSGALFSSSLESDPCTDTIGLLAITFTDPASCSSFTIEREIPIDKPPSVVLIPDQICPGDTSGLLVENPVSCWTYSWSPTETIVLVDGDDGPNARAFPSETTTYLVTISNGDTSIIDSVTVEVIDFSCPVTISGTDGRYCRDTEFEGIMASSDCPNIAYEWGPEEVIVSGGNTGSPTFMMSESTEVTVTFTDTITGCSKDTSFVIDIAPDLTVEITSDKGTMLEVDELPVTLTATSDGEGPFTYQWDNGSTTESITVSPEIGETTYRVTVTDAAGCTGESEITITVLPPCVVGLPDAFSPNGDGNNDLFTIRSTREFTALDFQIVNRWGNVVFESRSPSVVSWDGRTGGEDVHPDVFAYCAVITCEDGMEFTLVGNVTLVR